MTQEGQFEIAGGSVAGRDHRTTLKNSHDAYYWEAVPGILVAVVCDGCGSGEHSEVGAKLGARIVVKQVIRWFQNDPKAFSLLGIERGLIQVRRSVLAHVQLLADQMAGSFSQIISDYFLFTVVGAIVTPEDTITFGAGDGVIVVNGATTNLISETNTPDYLSYGLVNTENGLNPVLRKFTWHKTSEVNSVLLGTDGVRDLAKAADKAIPGKDEKVGPLEQFWKEDRYFKNSFAIQRRLALANRSMHRVDYEKKVAVEEHGHLPDDTTVLVIRRKSG